ncbi:type VI secretion system baseplate subunit TssE [Achromobacter sp. AGC25]
MPTDTVYSPLPLFDRLAADAEPQLAGAEAQRRAVARDLGRLLNTRSRLDFDAFSQSSGTVIDYGVPDYSARSPVSAGDREAIAAVVGHAIALYEPRLCNVSVDMTPAGNGIGPCRLEIRADMRVGGALSHVAFDMLAGAQGGTGAAYD